MSFDSPLFLSTFLPVTVLLHCSLPGFRAKNVLLLIAGLLFCAFGSLSGAAVLLVCITINYMLGRYLMHFPGSKAMLAFGVAGNLLFLGCYKYLAFFARDILGLPEFSAAAGSWIAPLGISFFTFKGISYLIDTCRRPEDGTKSFLSFALYVSFFPQITAGPISRYPDFAPQLNSRDCGISKIAAGFRRFILGLGKKLLLAYPMSEAVNAVFSLSGDSLSSVLAWLAAIAYMLQIFFDFSAYSDMAIGLGGMFGFDTKENFDFPYIASSLTDFWRRWHISLSSWFRDYLYIPLGGNRKGQLRAAFNKIIVFTLCGFWHGAAWTFLLWGLWHGIFAALETLQIIPSKRMQKTVFGKAVGHVYTLMVVCLGFVLFRAATVQNAWQFISAMFAFRIGTPTTSVWLHRLLTKRMLLTALLCILFCLPVEKKFQEASREKSWLVPVSYVVSLLLLALCLCAMAAVGFQPFIYAQF